MRSTRERDTPEKRSAADAIEMGDLEAGIDQARHPLELGAMLARDRQRVRDIAGIADLGRICVALPQKWARPRAGGEREHDAAARNNSPAEGAEAQHR